MPLPDAYLKPFDMTYELVTEIVVEYAGKLPRATDKEWLSKLITDFQSERDLWNAKAELEPYRKEFARLRPRFLRLAAAAYLHISYDLPRVMAAEWPGRPPWLAPSEYQGEAIFFGVDRAFPSTFGKVAKKIRVMGFPAFVLKPFPSDVLANTTHWVQLLRNAAWRHGHLLSNDGNRTYREGVMLDAITLALKDVSNWKPWKVGTLLPPDSAFPPNGGLAAAVTPVSFSEIERFWIGAAMTIVFLSTIELMRRRRQYKEVALFIDELGRRTYEYVNVAAYDPEHFETYRRELLSGSGERDIPESSSAT
jgi:hypothetical protein